jgi:predicted Fe-Mo cluster-binding NifX family protein
VLVAIPNCQGRVSPVFDVAARLMMVRLWGRTERGREDVTLFETLPAGIVRSIVELGVNVLICGAISQMLEAALVEAGVRVVPRVCGEVEAVLRAYRAGTLGAREFRMPGCCSRAWGGKGRIRPSTRGKRTKRSHSVAF